MFAEPPQQPAVAGELLFIDDLCLDRPEESPFIHHGRENFEKAVQMLRLPTGVRLLQQSQRQHDPALNVARPDIAVH